MFGWTLAALSPMEIAPVVRRTTQVNPVEALSLMVLGRFRDYERLHEADEQFYPDVFSPEPIEIPSEWELVRAAALSMMHPNEHIGMSRLVQLAHSSEAETEIRAVATLLLSVSYADVERREDAVNACRYLINEMLPLPAITTAALYAQLSLREAENEDYVSARASCAQASILLDEDASDRDYCAQAFQFISHSNVVDVFDRVKSLIQAAVSRNSALFDSMNEGAKSVNIEPNETPNRNLRNRLLSEVAFNSVKENFDRHTRERVYLSRTQTIGRENIVTRNLHAVWLSSQLSGDWLDVMSSSGIVGREWVTRKEDEPDSTQWLQRQGVRLLRVAGDSKAYTQAIRLMREEGPLEIVKKELSQALERFPASLSKADFEAIRAGAPLLSAEEANTACRVILDHSFPSYQNTVGGGWFSTREPMWNAIAALSLEASDSDFLAAQIRQKLDDAHSVTIQAVLPVLARLDWSRVSQEERRLWLSYCSRSDGKLANDELSEVRSVVLYELTRNGESGAAELLDASLSVRLDLSQAATLVDLHERGFSELLGKYASSVIELCQNAISNTIKEASHGAYSFGGVNEGMVAAAVCLDFPDVANWPHVCDFLRHPKVASYKKDPVLSLLARKYERVPEWVRIMLAQDPEALKSPEVSSLYPWSSSGYSGPRLRFLVKSEGLSSSEILGEFTGMLRDEDVSQRVEAARSAPVLAEALGQDLVFGLILGLFGDGSVLVRAEAAETLAYFANFPGESSVHAVKAMGDFLSVDGVAVPFGVLRGVKRYGLPDSRDISIRLRKYLRRTSAENSIARVRSISTEFSEQLE